MKGLGDELERFLKRVYERTSQENSKYNTANSGGPNPFVFACFHDYLEDLGTTKFLMNTMKSACPEADVRFLSFL